MAEGAPGGASWWGRARRSSLRRCRCRPRRWSRAHPLVGGIDGAFASGEASMAASVFASAARRDGRVRDRRIAVGERRRPAPVPRGMPVGASEPPPPPSGAEASGCSVDVSARASMGPFVPASTRCRAVVTAARAQRPSKRTSTQRVSLVRRTSEECVSRAAVTTACRPSLWRDSDTDRLANGHDLSCRGSGGTLHILNFATTQSPRGVPATEPSTCVADTAPVRANVTAMRTPPEGASVAGQRLALSAA